MATDLVGGTRFDERGMATAEYAVGTLAVVGMVGALIKISTEPWFQELIHKIFEALANWFLSWLGAVGL